MYYVPNALSEYIDAVCGGRDWISGLIPPESEDFYVAVTELFHGKLYRKKKIRKAFSALISSRYLTVCQLKYKPYFKVKAYMTDSGRVCFSAAHVWSIRNATMAKLLLHEAAHLWLSQQECYAALKQLDKAFRARYAIGALALSPVEYYAIALSVKMLERLLPMTDDGARKDVLSQIEREKSKLTDLSVLTDNIHKGE